MARKKSIIQLVTIIILAIAGMVLAVVPFAIPGSVNDFKSLAGSIKLGIDLKGGIVAVYDAELPEGETGNLNDYIKATNEKILKMLVSKGYTEASVTRQGASRIRVEVPDVDNPDEIFDMIGQPAELIISGEDTYEKAKEAADAIKGKDIANVFASYQTSSSGQNEWGVSIEFKSGAKATFASMTQNAANNGTKIYMYINGVEKNGGQGLGVEKAITDGKTFISGGMNSQKDAEDYALQVMSGTYSVKLTIFQNTIVSATLGENALKNSLIAGAIGLLLIFIFMFIVYKGLGLIANLSLLIYTVLLLFFLATVPLVQLSLPGIAGILLSIGMAVDANIIIFERVKDEYRVGKKIKVCFNEGYKKSISAIADSNITTILVSLVLLFVGTGAIKGFAITLLIGIGVSLFTSLVITRWLMSIVLRISDKKGNIYALKRGAENAK